MKELNNKKIIYKVSIVTIVMNAILTIGKIIAGALAKSSSLISDGVHSGSDVLSTIIVMIGAKFSNKEADEDHPYGHERMESIASILLAMLLVGTAVLLGYNGIISIIDFSKGNIPEKSSFIYLALGFAIASIVIKFWMFIYTLSAAKKVKSTALKADAYHHLSDSLSSIGSVLGIVGIMIGGYWAILDPIASLIIALFILKVSYDICKEAIDQLVDKAAPQEFYDELIKLIESSEGVRNVNKLRTRQFGNKIYIELSIAVDPNITVSEGHEIGSKIHHKIEEKYENVKHCSVHIDPRVKEREL